MPNHQRIVAPVTSRPFGKISFFVAVLIAFSGPFEIRAAGRRVVVLPFSGPWGARARQAVTRSLRGLSPIPLSRYRAVAKKLGVKRLRSQDVPQLCRKLGCAAIISGSVRRLGKNRFRVSLVTYHGKTGRIIVSRRFSVRRRTRIYQAAGSLGNRARRRILNPYRPRVKPARKKTAQSADDEADGQEFSFEPEVVTRTAKRRRTRRSAKRRRVKRVARRRQKRPASKSSWRSHIHDAGHLWFAGGISRRSYELRGVDVDDRRVYAPANYFELTVGVELFPLIPFFKGAWTPFGMALRYSRGVGLRTNLPPDPTAPALGAQAVNTSSQEFQFDLRYRWRISESPLSPRVTGLIGFGTRDFTLGDNPVFTSFNYRLIRFGMYAMAPLGTPWAALRFGSELHSVLEVGSAATAALGTNTSAMGWSLSAGLHGRLSFGLTYFTSLEVQRYAATFNGLNEQGIVPRPSTPERAAPSRGTEKYLRFWFGIGYAP